MAADLVLLSEQEGIATVTVNRPEKLNALNDEVISLLTAAFERCRQTSSVGAVILTGAGEKAFVAGADIKYMAGLGSEPARGWGGLGHEAASLLEEMPKPTIRIP